MEPQTYEVSDRFHTFLFEQEQGVEPILIADQEPVGEPHRLFLVRYVLGEGGGGESKRPIFKNELTGYDYEMKLTYSTQRDHLEKLQSAMESFMYAPKEATLSKAPVRNQSAAAERPIKVIISKELVAKLIDLYEYAW